MNVQPFVVAQSRIDHSDDLSRSRSYISDGSVMINKIKYPGPQAYRMVVITHISRMKAEGIFYLCVLRL